MSHCQFRNALEPALFEMVTILGNEIKEPQVFGAACFIDNPERKVVSVYFKRDGVVVCKHYYGRFEHSDFVAHLATGI